MDCTDGDPSCDTDGACGNGCLFSVAVCARQDDVTGCEPHDVVAFPVNTGNLTLPATPVTSATCADPTLVGVTLKRNGKKAGKRTIRLVAASDTSPKKDKDKLVLRCLPRQEGCPVTTTTTVVTSSTVSTSTGPPTTTTTLACTTGLGARTFSVAPAAAFFSSGANGASAAKVNSGKGSLSLCAGAPDVNGVASLTVNGDSVFGLAIIDGSIVCVRVGAAGSVGKIDCDGGTPVGVSYTQDSHGTGTEDPPVLASEQGAPGVAGDGYIMTQVRIVNCDATPDPGDTTCIAPVTTVDDCFDPTKVHLDVADGEMHVLTTGTSTTQVLNPRAGSPGGAAVTKTGAPFSCASWVEDGPGTLVFGLFGLDAGPTGTWDTANTIQIDD